MDREHILNLVFKIADLLESEYVFPNVANEIAMVVRRKAGDGGYDDIATEPQFADLVTADIRSVNNDKHLLVAPTVPGRRNPTQSESKRRLQLMRDHNFGFKTVEMLDSRVGYLEIDAFINTAIPGAGEAAVAAMQRLSDAECLVFDLRENSGGSPTMIQLVTTYLFDGDPIHLNSFYFRKTDTYKQFWTLPFVPGKRMPDAFQ